MPVPTASLPISRAADGLLITAAGEPVWPARGGAERALEAVAEVFGASLVETEAIAGTTAGGDELVIGVGEHNASNAQLYAHLTKRRHRVIASLDDSPALDGVAVIVCQWEQLSFASLDRIHSHNLSHEPIGLIVGHGPDLMGEQLLVRAAAASLAGTDEPSASVIYTDWSGAQKQLGRTHLLGANAGAPSLRAALSRGASVLSINGHGDGLDMQLGANETLCGVLGGELSAPVGRVPDCVRGGYCYRTNQPLPEALRGEELVDPARLRCRVGVFSSCFTIPARDALVDPRWSVLGRWVDSAAIGAILAPFGLSMLSPDGRLKLVQALLYCRDVGAALRWFNQTEEVSAGRIRLCIFGDPRVRVSADPLEDLGVDDRRDPEPSPRPRVARADERLRARAELLRRVLEEARHTAPSDEVVASLEGADELLRAVGAAHDPNAASVDEAGRAALTVLLQCRPVWHLFPEFSTPYRELDEPARACAICGERVRVYRLAFRRQDWPARLQGQCDRCGIVSDVEAGSPLVHATFELHGDRLELPAQLRRPSARVGLTLRPWHRQKATWELAGPSWTAPASAFEPGALSAYVLALDQLEIVFLRRQFEFEGQPARP